MAVPQPRELHLTGGLTDLSTDVRLVTSNVAPLYRKTMRTVLAGAGIRVVANKKKFIIDVRVEAPDSITFDGVPEAAREEYYEIEVADATVVIRTATQIGALWGAHALAGIYRALARGRQIPNLKIRDWPQQPVRAAWVKTLWGLDRMLPEDWNILIERLAAGRLNALGIPFDGGRNVGSPETACAGILPPQPDKPERMKEVSLTWYSPSLRVWKRDVYQPRFQGENFLLQILAVARENGLTPFPVFSGLGERTALPRLEPAIGARDAAGKPAGHAYCLSAPETRRELQPFYQGLVKTFFPEGTPFIMVHLGEPPAAVPGKKGVPGSICGCAKCRKAATAKLIQDHLVWLVEVFTTAGVRRVVFHDEMAPELAAAVFTPDFTAALKKAKLFDACTVTARPAAKTAPAKEGALSRWTAPASTLAVWTATKPFMDGIFAELAAGHAAGHAGVLVESCWDPAWYDSVDTYATAAWHAHNPKAHITSPEDLADIHAGDDAAAFREAKELLETVASTASPLAAFLAIPGYCPLQEEANTTRDLRPLIDALAGVKEIRKHLQAAQAAAAATVKKINAILEKEKKPADLEGARTLLRDAARIAGLTRVWEGFLDLRDALDKKKVDAKTTAAAEGIRPAALEMMAIIEVRHTKQAAPWRLAEFTLPLALADQMLRELAEVVDGKRKPADVAWKLAIEPGLPA
ncbi:MAG: glycoside hydrolase family 20 zincin-like fold domain-containing protein [Lentisphaeria bacterium]